MDTRDLSVFDQIKISRVAAKCDGLKSRLEAHSFKVRQFRIFISPDDAELLSILPERIGGILATVRFDTSLAIGEADVSALVQ